MLKNQTGHWLYMASHSHRQRRQPVVAQAIYRTTEAALANVERHACATQVTVKLTATGVAVALSYVR